MKLAVKDANVLIDLVEADLLGHWFKLGIETHTTNLVLLVKGNCFLPKHDCAERLKRWSVG